MVLMCCLCDKKIKNDKYGHNPEPCPLTARAKENGRDRCCNQCNMNKVIPMRMACAGIPHHYN